MTYTPDISESGSIVTVEYEVCNTNTSVCGTATVNIDVQCDASDVLQDCDYDGNSNGTDPNPSVPTAEDDGVFVAIP